MAKSGKPHSLGHGTESNPRADAARQDGMGGESLRPVVSPQAATKVNPNERRDSLPGPPSHPESERPSLWPSGEGNTNAGNHAPVSGSDGKRAEEEAPITLPEWERPHSLSRRQRGGMWTRNYGDMPEVPARAGPNPRTRPIRLCRNGRCRAPGSRMGSW